MDAMPNTILLYCLKFLAKPTYQKSLVINRYNLLFGIRDILRSRCPTHNLFQFFIIIHGALIRTKEHNGHHRSLSMDPLEKLV